LTLIGDSVDNVPGVHKVGPKTAVKWLSQYRTLDNLMTHAGEIPGVVGENLRKSLDWLPQARKLLTVKCDVDLPVVLSDLVLRPQDAAKLNELFERFEFKSWLKDNKGPGAESKESDQTGNPALSPSLSPIMSHPSTRHYETILTEAQLEKWLKQIHGSPLVAVDTETTGLDPLRDILVGISFSVNANRAAYIPVAHRYPGAPAQLDAGRVLERLKPWLEDADKHKLGQNLKYDKHIFANHGVVLNGIAHDTLLESYVLESHKPHDMDNLAERHLCVKTITYDEVTGKGANRISFDQVEIDRAAEYAAEDADITLQLHQALYPQIAADSRLENIYRRIEIPLLQVLFSMERNGVLLDV
ncbi:MAG: 5'-3' exonuclease H3TH domain-containing protein, partial [Burkholderiales bacterium]